MQRTEPIEQKKRNHIKMSTPVEVRAIYGIYIYLYMYITSKHVHITRTYKLKNIQPPDTK